MPMNIYANPGAKVTYSNPTNGRTSDQVSAEQHLDLGKTYTVLRTVVDTWSTDVFLEEIPNVPFNSVLFEDVPGETGTPPKITGDTKISRVGNTYTRITTDGKQVVPHPNIDIDNWYVGYTGGTRPSVGECIVFHYSYRNGHPVYGQNILRTTPIIKIEGDLYHTKNSIYKIEHFNEDQSS